MLRPVGALRLAWLMWVFAACAPEPAEPSDAAAEPTPAAATRRVWLPLGGETFTLEVAADSPTRYRGLSGRARIERNGGMLFIYPDVAPRGMVMRDCAEPIDVAFLDASARVVALWAMPAEAPQLPNESRGAYAARLPIYRSGRPALFAIEVAGGRLADLGVSIGDSISLDVDALRALAR